MYRYTMEGLRSGHVYRVRVMAHNDKGKGTFSVPAELLTGFSTPHPPPPPVITGRSTNSVIITWCPPEQDGGSPITAWVSVVIGELLDLSKHHSITMGLDFKLQDVLRRYWLIMSPLMSVRNIKLQICFAPGMHWRWGLDHVFMSKGQRLKKNGCWYIMDWVIHIHWQGFLLVLVLKILSKASYIGKKCK